MLSVLFSIFRVTVSLTSKPVPLNVILLESMVDVAFRVPVDEALAKETNANADAAEYC